MGTSCPDCGKNHLNSRGGELRACKLSKYEDRLLSWYRDNPDVILPKSKRKEVIRFIESGLSDLSITRQALIGG